MVSGYHVLIRTPLPPRPVSDRHGSGWFLVSYLSFAASFHYVWEIAHIRLYTIWRTARSSEIAFAIMHCTIGDVLIAAAAMGLALMMVRADGCEARRVGKLVAIATALGVVYTVSSEWLNVEIRQAWAYTEAMPRLPLLGTGLTPFLQWLLVTPVAALIARATAQPSHPQQNTRRRDRP